MIEILLLRFSYIQEVFGVKKILLASAVIVSLLFHDVSYADDVVRRNAEKYLGVAKLPVSHNRNYPLSREE